MTLGEALREGARAAGHRAALLLLRASAGDAYVHGDRPLSPAQAAEYAALLARLAGGEPLQYVLGEWDFCGIAFKVDKRALIPRPETELLALAAARALGGGPKDICDACAGGGCVGLAAVCADGGRHRLTLADICPDALALAGENARMLAGRHQSEVRLARWDLLAGAGGMFDVVVSNPPYIRSGDMEGLPPGVKDYEPRIALDGGPQGLCLYERLLPQAYAALRPGGRLLLEIGPPEAAETARRAGFGNVEVLRDYAGRERIVAAER